MNENEFDILRNKFKGWSLSERLERYANHPEEKIALSILFDEFYCEKPYKQYEESLKEIPWVSEEVTKRVKTARTYAVSIISSLLNFDDINSLKDIRIRVEHELEVAEGFAKPIFPDGR